MSKYTREQVIEKIENGESLAGFDLTHINLSEINMSNSNLRNADLRGAYLRGVNLSEANLRGANLSDANLCEANLIYANLCEANLIGANLRGANLRGANLRNADLSGANLSGADLTKANLSEVDLGMADLCKANLNGANLCKTNLNLVNLRGANLRGADLSGTDLSGTDLSGTDLRGADLSVTDLSRANLTKAKLHEVDLSYAILSETKFREEDLAGVKYRPEQLKDMVIERTKKEPLLVPKQKGRLTIRFTNEKPKLLHLISWIKRQYDYLYVLLFNQYKSIDKLTEILSGSPYHLIKDEDTVEIISISKQSPLAAVLQGLYALWLPIYSFIQFYSALPGGTQDDIYQYLKQTILKTKKDKLEEKHLETKIEKEEIEKELLKADTLNKYADFIDKCRKLGQEPVDLVPPSIEEESLPPAIVDRGLSHQIDQQRENLAKRIPRQDLFKFILLMRQEGLLTNKLDAQVLANILEIFLENLGREYKSMISQTGKFEMDIEPDDPEDT